MSRRTTKQIRAAVIESLRVVLGDESSAEIADETDPVSELGLDSFAGLEFACELSDKLGYHIPGEENPFYKERAGKTRSVAEIVKFVEGLMSGEEASAND